MFSNIPLQHGILYSVPRETILPVGGSVTEGAQRRSPRLGGAAGAHGVWFRIQAVSVASGFCVTAFGRSHLLKHNGNYGH